MHDSGDPVDFVLWFGSFRVTSLQSRIILSYPGGRIDIWESSLGREPVRVADISPTSLFGAG